MCVQRLQRDTSNPEIEIIKIMVNKEAQEKKITLWNRHLAIHGGICCYDAKKTEKHFGKFQDEHTINRIVRLSRKPGLRRQQPWQPESTKKTPHCSLWLFPQFISCRG